MKRHAYFLFLALFLIEASRFARGADATHDFNKYEKEISAFEEADRAAPPPKGAILFTGASHIRRWTTLAQDFPQVQVINRGFGGSDIRDATHFASRIIFPYAPKAIYFRAGGNELWNGRRSVDDAFGDFKDFVAVVHSKYPETDIVFISNVRSIARAKQAEKERALNTLIADFIRGKKHLRYIDVYDLMVNTDGRLRPECFVEDGLHFSPVGYKLLAARVSADLANGK
jgi:lysophospholipase L1-like esterase